MESTARIFATFGFIFGLIGAFDDDFPTLPAHFDSSYQTVANAMMGMTFTGIIGLILGFLVFKLPAIGIELIAEGGTREVILGVIGLCISAWVIYQVFVSLSVPG